MHTLTTHTFTPLLPSVARDNTLNTALTLYSWHTHLTAADVTRKCHAFPSKCEELVVAPAAIDMYTVLGSSDVLEGNARSQCETSCWKASQLIYGVKSDRIMGCSHILIISTSLKLQLGQAPKQWGTQRAQWKKQKIIREKSYFICDRYLNLPFKRNGGF